MNSGTEQNLSHKVTVVSWSPLHAAARGEAGPAAEGDDGDVGELGDLADMLKAFEQRVALGE